MNRDLVCSARRVGATMHKYIHFVMSAMAYVKICFAFTIPVHVCCQIEFGDVLFRC